MEKTYIKGYLVGNDSAPIIGEIENVWHSHLDNQFRDYLYGKGKDLVTGMPIILTKESSCTENDFDKEISMYGISRANRLGVLSTYEFITKQEAIDFLEGMTKEDVIKYIENVKIAKKKHIEMLKKYTKNFFQNKLLIHKENKKMILQKNRVRRINKNDN